MPRNYFFVGLACLAALRLFFTFMRHVPVDFPALELSEFRSQWQGAASVELLTIKTETEPQNTHEIHSNVFLTDEGEKTNTENIFSSHPISSWFESKTPHYSASHAIRIKNMGVEGKPGKDYYVLISFDGHEIRFGDNPPHPMAGNWERELRHLFISHHLPGVEEE